MPCFVLVSSFGAEVPLADPTGPEQIAPQRRIATPVPRRQPIPFPVSNRFRVIE